jgi:hypothetical protein
MLGVWGGCQNQEGLKSKTLATDNEVKRDGEKGPEVVAMKAVASSQQQPNRTVQFL